MLAGARSSCLFQNAHTSCGAHLAHPLFKQGRHCVCNVKLWCICVTIVAMAMEEYILIVFDLHLAVTIVNVFSVATEMQQWVPLALLSSYKMFCTAVNNINVLRSWACKGPDIFVRIYPSLEFLDMFIKVPSIKFHGNLTNGKSADMCRWTYGQDEAIGHFLWLMQTHLK